jgi:hypothetical protein
MKFSPSGMYGLDERKPSILYVRGESPHPWLKRTSGKPIQQNESIYYPYQYFDTLQINDCLQFAEAITSGIKDYADTKCILREKGSRFDFGKSYSSEIAMSKGKSPTKTYPRFPEILNENANPEIGESYAIVRGKTIQGEVPYHIAFVIAKDGDTNITLEADAGNPDLNMPVFDMYSPRDTFHDRYKELYAPASTMVLEKK